ncbi:hypothetical protein NIES4074_12370 [Cylindrospermum sp. NIES-4074]|nr:hypothetical protein NIES4074_12370 [Cylindrospermum sp. NIES-4074]
MGRTAYPITVLATNYAFLECYVLRPPGGEITYLFCSLASYVS